MNSLKNDFGKQSQILESLPEDVQKYIENYKKFVLQGNPKLIDKKSTSVLELFNGHKSKKANLEKEMNSLNAIAEDRIEATRHLRKCLERLNVDSIDPKYIRNGVLECRILPSWNWADHCDHWPVLNQFSTNACVGFAIGDGVLNFLINRPSFRPDSVDFPHAFSNRTNRVTITDRVSVRYIWMLGKEFDNPGANQNIEDWNGVSANVIDDHSGTDLISTLKAMQGMQEWLHEQDLPFMLNSPFLYYRQKLDGFNNLNRVSARFFAANSDDFNFFVLMSAPLFERGLSQEQRDKFVENGGVHQLNSSLLSFLRCWLAVIGPVLIEVLVDSNFKDITAANHPCVLDDFDWSSISNMPSYHAMVVVGFDENHFICKNSWGENWGENGFVKITHNYFVNSTTELIAITNIKHD